MRKLFLIVAFLGTIGCNKNHTMGAANINESLIIGAGQSNMERMSIQSLLPSRIRTLTDITTINTAVGNTGLWQWEKGGELYQPMITKALNKHLPIAYMVYYQGEWEGMNVTGSNTWAERFTKFVRDVRRDLNSPDLKVIFFRINSHNMYGPAWDTVRAQQEMVSIPGVTMLSSDGCDLGVDGLHYSDPGYSCLADRIATEING